MTSIENLKKERFTYQSNMEHCSIDIEYQGLLYNTRYGDHHLDYGSSSLLLTMMRYLDIYLSLDGNYNVVYLYPISDM